MSAYAVGSLQRKWFTGAGRIKGRSEYFNLSKHHLLRIVGKKSII